MIIYKPKFERIKEEMEIKLPTEPIYYFSSRRAIRLIPEYTTWERERSGRPEYIWRYDCTVVDINFRASIERFYISAEEKDFQRIVDYKEDRSKHTLAEEIYYKLIYFPNDDLRTKEQFEADLKAALDKIMAKNPSTNTPLTDFFLSVDNTAPCLLDELLKANAAADVEPLSASDIQKICGLEVGESVWVGVCEIKRVALTEQQKFEYLSKKVTENLCKELEDDRNFIGED